MDGETLLPPSLNYLASERDARVSISENYRSVDIIWLLQILSCIMGLKAWRNRIQIWTCTTSILTQTYREAWLSTGDNSILDITARRTTRVLLRLRVS